MNFIYLNRRNIIQHLTIWLVFLILQHRASPYSGNLSQILIANVFLLLQLSASFYFLSFVIFQLLYEKSKELMILSVFGYFFIYVAIYIFIEKVIYPYFNIFTKNQHKNLFQISVICLWIYFLIVAASWSFFLNYYNLYKLKEQDKRRKKLIQRELSFLKGQFNSHLTFNFFNFCYSSIYKKLDTTAKAIETFSDMLRYSLEKGQKKIVSITEEVNYIHNYLNTQKLISSNVSVNVRMKEYNENLLIIPFVLTSIVEMAFLNGVFNDENNPLHILLKTKEKTLWFEVAFLLNIKSSRKQNLQNYDNLKKILELFYPNRYKLEIFEAHTVVYKLVIDLNFKEDKYY